MQNRPGDDPRAAVVVPARPGPLVRLDQVARRDEVDDILDDLFGAPDDRGPSAADWAMLGIGVVAAVAAWATDLPNWIGGIGLVLVVLGAILPMRSLIRRLQERSQHNATMAVVGDGTVLLVDGSVARLVELHDRLIASGHLAETRRREVAEVAHAAVSEVASLLAGRTPTNAAESEYISARIAALEELVTVVSDPTIGDGDSAAHRARVEARLEVEHIAGTSSVSAAAALVDELRGNDDR